LHDANPVDQNARAAFYGVTSPLRAFVDGGFGQTSSAATFMSGLALDTYFNLRSLVTSPVTIAIDFPSGPETTQLNIKATVQAVNDLGSPGNYNVFIAVAEREVIVPGVQLPQAYVLRKLLPHAAGTPLTSLSPTDPPQEIITSYDMRHVTRSPNGGFEPFAVIVFVQHLETKDVLQTALRQDATTSPEIVTGIETSPDNYIKVYPNPADAQLNIILPAPVKGETPVKLFDTFGKQVFSGVYKAGEHIKALETKSFSAGVYLIQLSTPEGVVRKKAIVAHE
jgi:hypothetical protein